MKIAVATEEGTRISSHFGRSPFFAIFEIEDKEIVHQTMRKNTFTHHSRGTHDGHDHESSGGGHSHDSVATGLGDCAAVISRGMGRRAFDDLSARGIEMIVTDETDVLRAVELYISGGLENRTERLHEHGGSHRE
ncbi:MAG: NifB/NifX family molybdenum-iron cluster-binding protein [Bacteroidota bacterium]